MQKDGGLSPGVETVQTKDGKCAIVELEKQHGELMKSV